LKYEEEKEKIMAELKTILITGAAGGIGRATVNIFSGKGWRVIGVDRAVLSEVEGRRLPAKRTLHPIRHFRPKICSLSLRKLTPLPILSMRWSITLPSKVAKPLMKPLSERMGRGNGCQFTLGISGC
jgi:hypothetical protein